MEAAATVTVEDPANSPRVFLIYERRKCPSEFMRAYCIRCDDCIRHRPFAREYGERNYPVRIELCPGRGGTDQLEAGRHGVFHTARDGRSCSQVMVTTTSLPGATESAEKVRVALCPDWRPRLLGANRPAKPRTRPATMTEPNSAITLFNQATPSASRRFYQLFPCDAVPRASLAPKVQGKDFPSLFLA